MDCTEAELGKLPIKDILRRLSGIMSINKEESKKKDKLVNSNRAPTTEGVPEKRQEMQERRRGANRHW
ncbi:hypothetical protein PISMIDRAFT_17461 [Pisolithus microcarpus 441]|uniref:Unplaced genomic scaffold scaffold_266, whole genome shotgun sequence n=1 Tax=Pisolithus microcarpus 441 TaxID=765257 RepID=A0A0C9YVI9_9AGAM|nr:hypothetical protein PISMIDRAFT_17461 [Pisolithus microcarpus 441]